MPEDQEFEKYLERRAEELGLPTDPAAYQDGGLAVAATATSLSEAELLSMVLKAAGIPAWVDSPSQAQMDGFGFMGSAGQCVLVPLGRLADAERALADHRHESQEPSPQTASARLRKHLWILPMVFAAGVVTLFLLSRQGEPGLAGKVAAAVALAAVVLSVCGILILVLRAMLRSRD